MNEVEKSVVGKENQGGIRQNKQGRKKEDT